MSAKHAYLMMIKEKWWNEFRLRKAQEIHSYVHTGLAPPTEAQLIMFYVSKPVGEIAGYAEFIERKAGDSDAIWKEHGHESVISSKKKYDEFIGEKKSVSFIRFKNIREAKKPIPLNNALLLLGMKRMARRGFYLDKGTADILIEEMQCKL